MRRQMIYFKDSKVGLGVYFDQIVTCKQHIEYYLEGKIVMIVAIDAIKYTKED